jgi:hypothetical protein
MFVSRTIILFVLDTKKPEDLMSVSITQRLHEGLHALPGMPPHSEAAGRNQHAGAGAVARPGAGRAGHWRPGLTSPDAHHSRPPRMLVGWQTWIGERFAGRNRQG